MGSSIPRFARGLLHNVAEPIKPQAGGALIFGAVAPAVGLGAHAVSYLSHWVSEEET